MLLRRSPENINKEQVLKSHEIMMRDYFKIQYVDDRKSSGHHVLICFCAPIFHPDMTGKPILGF